MHTHAINLHIPNTYINFAAYFGFVCAIFIMQILKYEFLYENINK